MVIYSVQHQNILEDIIKDGIYFPQRSSVEEGMDMFNYPHANLSQIHPLIQKYCESKNPNVRVVLCAIPAIVPEEVTNEQ